MATVQPERVENAQILRFVAAGLVLIGHTLHEASELGFAMGSAADALPWGMGVDIFFVISGFIMVYVAGDGFGRPGAPRDFLIRRLRRIVPLYWLFTTLSLAAIVFLSGAVNHAEINGPYVAASYGFLPWPRAAGDLKPVLALGWTLNYEMIFYALFGLALLAPRRIGLPTLAGALVVMAALNPVVPSSWFMVKYWTNPIILEFLAGLGIGLLYRRGVRLPLWAALPVIALAFALTPAEAGVGARWYTWGLAAAVITAACVLTRPAGDHRVARWLSLAGAASYALYLSHPFVLNIAAIGWRKLGLGQPWLFVAAACFGAVAASLVVHLWVERPIDRALRRRRRPQAGDAMLTGALARAPD